MLGVTDTTKKIYTEHNVHKVLTISFPEDDIDDITNENIVSESMKLLGSICEESTPQVGGCNASQFEITIFDIKQDITNKKIIVTLSCKDPNYKGEWSTGTDYQEGDIVKTDSGYFEYIQDPEGDFTDEVKINTFEINKFTLSNNIYTYAEESNLDLLKSLTICFTQSSLDEVNTFKIRVRAWYTGYAYYVDKFVTSNPTSVEIAKTYGGYPLAGWNISIYDSANQTDEETLTKLRTLANSIYVYKFTYKTISEYPPGEISDYASKIYGYIDTSEVEDMTLFKGKIKSVKSQNNRRFKDVLAYDKMYELQNTDVSSWFNSNVADNNWKGDWVQGTLYKVGQIVQLYVSPDGYSGNYIFYKCKKQVTSLASKYNPMVLCAGLSMMTSPPMTETEAKSYWEEVSKEDSYDPKKYVSIKSVRDGVFSYLEIEQQEVSLPLDDLLVYVEPINHEIKAMDLLQQICNANVRFGRINPQTEIFEYLSISEIVADENYKGEFVPGTTNSAGDVVMLNNEYTEYCNKYFECILSTDGLASDGEIANSYEPTDELVENFWKEKGVLYHPSGRINLTQLYEMDGAEYQNYNFINNHEFYVEDTDGNVLQGAKTDTAVAITQGIILGCLTSTQLYERVVNFSDKFMLNFVPAKLTFKGLPFLEVGDQVCFDVEENGEIKTVNTVVMCKTLSGINALTDEIEAEYE